VCFEKFAADASVPRDATALRALLELCQDASALNTGVELGYKVMPQPLSCRRWSRKTVEDKVTGPEFVLPNGTLKPEELGRGWSVVELERLENARYDLRRGYCGCDCAASMIPRPVTVEGPWQMSLWRRPRRDVFRAQRAGLGGRSHGDSQTPPVISPRIGN
jgi:hypothetical protein